MLYLTCTIISKVDLARYGVSRAKDWIFVDCGSICRYTSPGLTDLDGFCFDSVVYSYFNPFAIRTEFWPF